MTLWHREVMSSVLLREVMSFLHVAVINTLHREATWTGLYGYPQAFLCSQ
jgi:hypothetical protein